MDDGIVPVGVVDWVVELVVVVVCDVDCDVDWVVVPVVELWPG